MARFTHLALQSNEKSIVRNGIKAAVVSVGHYSEPHHRMTAAEASGLILHAADPRGYEVIVPRKVRPDEIARVRAVRQVVGWRYWPDAHGRPPCPCPACVGRGEYGAAKLRERYPDDP